MSSRHRPGGQYGYAYTGYQPAAHYYPQQQMVPYHAPVGTQPFNGMAQMWPQQLPCLRGNLPGAPPISRGAPAQSRWCRHSVIRCGRRRRWRVSARLNPAMLQPSAAGGGGAELCVKLRRVSDAFYAPGGAADLRPSRSPSRPVAAVSLADPRHAATGRGIGGLKRPPACLGATTMPSGRPPMAVVWPAASRRLRVIPESFGFTQDHLPGWVTTYQESQFSGSCSWRSGSQNPAGILMITVIGVSRADRERAPLPSISRWLAMAERNVAVIDADPQATLTDVLEVRRENGFSQWSNGWIRRRWRTVATSWRSTRKS